MLATSYISLALVASLASARPLTRRAAEFGTCADPTITFGPANDRGGADAFTPTSSQFVHGSALNIGVIAGFICQQLQSPCGADATGLAACKSAQQAATGLQGQAAADAFNNAITGGGGAGSGSQGAAGGSQQGGAGGSSADSGSATIATAPADCTASTVTVTAPGTAQTAAPPAAAPPAAPAASSAAPAAAGGNFQTFTGALGGQTAPPVTAGGKGFVTDGSDFLNLGAALGRSCDVQHNACANAANSGGGFSVGDCDQQDTACRALIQN